MFVLDNLISFHAVNEMMKQMNSITGFHFHLGPDVSFEFYVELAKLLLHSIIMRNLRKLQWVPGPLCHLQIISVFFWIELSLATLFT